MRLNFPPHPTEMLVFLAKTRASLQASFPNKNHHKKLDRELILSRSNTELGLEFKYH